MKKGDLVLGGLGLAGGFVGASLLKPIISHHAGCPKDCAHLSPADVLTAACLQKCNQQGGLNAFIPPSAAGILKTAPGNKISAADAAANKSQDAFSLNPADNLPGGINQTITNTLTGAGCGGIFKDVPVLGTVPCWAIIIGAVGIIFLAPTISRFKL